MIKTTRNTYKNPTTIYKLLIIAGRIYLNTPITDNFYSVTITLTLYRYIPLLFDPITQLSYIIAWSRQIGRCLNLHNFDNATPPKSIII